MPAPRTAPGLNLVPRPTQSARIQGEFVLDPTTALRIGPGAERAAALLRKLLAPATGLSLPAAADGRIVLAVEPALSGLGDEGYGLTVGTDAVMLRAARPEGLLRGVQTLRQLLPPEALLSVPVPGLRWALPCAQITDTPRFRWRGAMLDVARHFQPISYVRRFVDLLAFHKLNVLHLHLTDDQGWRLPVPGYPRLTEVGGVRAETLGDGVPHGGSYTREELVSLVEYAADRGVTVVPEVEMPGHARAALAAYPELGNDPERQLDVWTRWGVCETVFGVHDETLDFCRAVLAEVMDIFPSRYIHVGGDECPVREWEEAPYARERAAELGLAEPAALHGWFMDRIAEFLLAHGRRPVGWTTDGKDLGPEYTAVSWIDADHGLVSARSGQDVIMAPHRATYLDYAQSDAASEPPGQPGNVVSLRDVYDFEPAPEEWEPAAQERVIGTQGQLWSEYWSTPDHCEHLAFPRLCALAEVAWAARGQREFTDFARRLVPHGDRLEALGVRDARSRTGTAGPAAE
ncbi:beta-N-acetylhexosaminidase [Streptomyces sp. NPDC004111]|uniref:beta-N-acetylhexosaminidase n=1 Tax=Streptomyces sp. NPDC004111 TaxID=3364690 RepID=UPI0036C5C215